MQAALTFREATESDLPAIVALLNDDQFGQARNPVFDAASDRYRGAFNDIAADPNNSIQVAGQSGRIIGCYQLTFIRGLSYTGGLRALIESVRIASDKRGQGLGDAMMRHAIGLARARGCTLVQLTTDVRRAHTRRFYEKLGFAATHHGMKLWL
jgi:ribosomal protein S18 acetylase RimI-like enzyme